jgi:hypothetical protein
MASRLKKKAMSHAQSNGAFIERSHGGDNMRRSGAPGLMVPGTSYGRFKCMGVVVVCATLQSHGHCHAGLFAASKCHVSRTITPSGGVITY